VILSYKTVEQWDFTKYRLGRKQAIRLKCLDCCGYDKKAIKMCKIRSCPLHPYRMGYPERLPLVLLSKLKEKHLQNQCED